MGKYYLQRAMRLNAGHNAEDLEHLAATGYLEMQRWIAGVTHLSLARTGDESNAIYLLTLTFASYQAYKHWRQVEEDGADYWERYAAIQQEWQEVCSLVSECAGDVVLNVILGNTM